MSDTNTQHVSKVGVVHCIWGPTALAEWIRQSFEDTLTTLDAVSGVREFHLRRLVAANLPHCLFLSVTVWDRVADFDRWQSSESFQDAHPDRERFSGEYAQLGRTRLDVPVEADTTTSDLDAAITQRLRAEQPGLIPVSEFGFVSQLHWQTAQFSHLGHRPPERFPAERGRG